MRLLRQSFVVLGLGAAVFAQERMADLSGETARVFASTRGQALTGRQASARAAVDAFLRGQGRSAAAIASLSSRSESRDAATGVTHLRLAQSFNGLPVYGAYVKAAVNASGELVHLIDQSIELRGQAGRSTLTADGAIAAAAVHPRRVLGERRPIHTLLLGLPLAETLRWSGEGKALQGRRTEQVSGAVERGLPRS